VPRGLQEEHPIEVESPLQISRLSALGAARAAMAGLAIESVATVLLYGAFKIWQVLR
jgi:hypothetical protein